MERSKLIGNKFIFWEMKDNEGYIKIISVMQKFFDQAISGNWSYNPENYPDNEVPVSVMANDFFNYIQIRLENILLSKHK